MKFARIGKKPRFDVRVKGRSRMTRLIDLTQYGIGKEMLSRLYGLRKRSSWRRNGKGLGMRIEICVVC